MSALKYCVIEAVLVVLITNSRRELTATKITEWLQRLLPQQLGDANKSRAIAPI